MTRRFEAVFEVERPLHAVWQACRMPTAERPPKCRIPAFPSLDRKPGCAATVIESVPQELLRVTKDDEPCAGTEIEIRIGPATAGGWPTRVSVRQSGFAPALLAAGDVVEAHWRHIVADFQLYLAQEVSVPGTLWGELGAGLKQTPIGVEIGGTADQGIARRCGMLPGDLLLTIGAIRIQTIEQLWTVLSLANADDELTVRWSREAVGR